MPRFYVLGLGDPLCRNGFGMMQNFVTNLIVVQTIDKLFWNFHKRLQWKLSLSRAISTFGSCIAVAEADSFPINQAKLAHRDPAASQTFARKNKANTAAKATAREQFMYGYMRSLRK